MHKFYLLVLILTLSACQSKQVIVPAVVHNVSTTEEVVVEKAHLPIIGEVEPIYFLKNRKTGEEHLFEKKIERSFRVKRVGKDEQRKAVKMDVKMGDEVFTAVFSIADRSGFDYQGLIGRNILTGRFLVDTSTSYTLD